ncbi:TraK domain-containing protein [Comamonas thiooxydans]|jgi:conjugal transfer pilus assembly protein TraK|nr:type-F conjugative transfer system secretin TraK [Comamonas thiooxydans]UBQ44543.1 type-F conjugative transfer system secretin TraK [Comamonas thiooxydans]
MICKEIRVMKANSKYLLAVSLAIAGHVHAQDKTPAMDDIPVVPAGVMRDNVPAPIGSRSAVANNQKARGQGAEAGVDSGNFSGNINSSSHITMKPGVNQIIPIAIGHPNRIVTPFSTPDITSTTLSSGGGGGEKDKCGEVCIKDNVIYIATLKESPVTMFITEKGSESQALSLTMIPRKIPPREVFVKLDGSFAGGMGGVRASANAKAEAWETSQPYIETIRTLFRKLALNEIPQGFTMTATPRELAAKAPKCSIPGLSVDFAAGQYMAGHNLNVYVGVARNDSQDLVEFRESQCANWNTAAITSWPLKVLEPGQRTEVYVAVKQGHAPSSMSQRPSLIGGRN